MPKKYEYVLVNSQNEWLSTACDKISALEDFNQEKKKLIEEKDDFLNFMNGFLKEN